MNLVGDLIAYVERKLFTLNTGHAITAYLGSLAEYKTVDESIKDEKIATIVKAQKPYTPFVLSNFFSYQIPHISSCFISSWQFVRTGSICLQPCTLFPTQP